MSDHHELHGQGPWRACSRFARFSLAAESGNILVLSALSLTFLCGVLALAVDVGRLLYAKRQLQTLADAAALAGALEVSQCGTTPNCAAMQNAAQSALVENGVSSVTLNTQCGNKSGTGLILTVNNGPCYLGAKDPNQGNTGYVEAVVSIPVKTVFASVVGTRSIVLNARAEAGGVSSASPYCEYILSSSGSQAALFNGNATLNASCGVIVNSNSSTAAIFNGGDQINATRLDIHGGIINNGNNTLNPSPNLGAAAVSDPLSGLAKPTGSCGSSTSSPYTGAQNQVIVNGGQTAVFNPGKYCGGIIINGNATAVFNGGTTPYIIQNGMIINGGDTVSGAGVTFYMASGQFTMNGGSHASFSAPTTGTYAGILYFQDSSDSNSVILNGDTTSKWEGTIYAPSAQLLLNGGANVAAYTNVIVNSMIENGNVNFTLGSDYSSLPGGDPIKGSGQNAYLVE